jgi:hypothetical protein
MLRYPDGFRRLNSAIEVRNMPFDNQVQWEIGGYLRALKGYSPKLAYKEEYENTEYAFRPTSKPSHRGRVVKFVVHHPLGDRVIPIRPGKERAAQLALLEELKKLLAYYKPRKALPHWLDEEAVEFCKSPTIGLHRFGRPIEITGKGKDGVERYSTREQLIDASNLDDGRILLDIFRYLPQEKERYKKSWLHSHALANNFQMYHLIEIKRMRPERARDALDSQTRELLKEIMLELAMPGSGKKEDLAKDKRDALLEAGPDLVGAAEKGVPDLIDLWYKLITRKKK